MTAPPLRIEKARTGLWVTHAPWHVYLRLPLSDDRLVLGRFSTFELARLFAIEQLPQETEQTPQEIP